MSLLASQFPTFKGMNYPYGTTAVGASAWRAWPYASYDLARINTHLAYMRSLGAREIRVWMWLDKMFDKTTGSPGWGSVGWDPASNAVAANIANWEDFLINGAIANGMKIMPVLLQPTISPNAYDATYDFETILGGDTDALCPTADGAALVSSTLLDGNLDTDPFSAPNTFIQSAGVTWQNITGSSPLDGTITKEIEVVGGASRYVGTSLATFDPADPLCLWQIDVKGNGVSVQINYYNSAGDYLGAVVARGEANYADWTTLSFGSVDFEDIDHIGVSPVKFRLVVYVSAGNTGYMAGHRCTYATHSAKWQNYVDMVEWFTSRYGVGTAYESAMCGWNLMNEQYSTTLRYHNLHPLLKTIYDAISGASAVPVIVDATSLDYGVVANQVWYDDICDIISLHIYDTDGVVPDPSNYNKPYIIGECGADLADRADDVINTAALQLIFDNAWAATTRPLCVMPWSFQDNTSISTPGLNVRLAPFVDGPAGRVIKLWRGGTSGVAISHPKHYVSGASADIPPVGVPPGSTYVDNIGRLWGTPDGDVWNEVSR